MLLLLLLLGGVWVLLSSTRIRHVRRVHDKRSKPIKKKRQTVRSPLANKSTCAPIQKEVGNPTDAVGALLYIPPPPSAF